MFGSNPTNCGFFFLIFSSDIKYILQCMNVYVNLVLNKLFCETGRDFPDFFVHMNKVGINNYVFLVFCCSLWSLI
jgi:hypothetical protein